MFRKLDEIAIANRPDSDAMAKALEIGDLAHICRLVGNVFEQALPEDSEVFTIRRQLSRLGSRRRVHDRLRFRRNGAVPPGGNRPAGRPGAGKILSPDFFGPGCETGIKYENAVHTVGNSCIGRCFCMKKSHFRYWELALLLAGRDHSVGGGFPGAAGGAGRKVIRLHVIANSDSPEDQALKLRVGTGCWAQEILEQSADMEQAEQA